MNPASGLLIGLVRGYQWLIAPVLPACCRFQPSCSHYAVEALARHGALTGAWLAAKRVARCHPWNEGGWDPVPEPKRTAGHACRHPDRTS